MFMINSKIIEKNQIEKIYKENYSKFHGEFLREESLFLSELHKRYVGDLECANVVLYFAKDLHQNILRQKENDLYYDISLNNFWHNHSIVKQKNYKIVEISKSTGFPKETTRRKIDVLLKKKVLKKEKNQLYWRPMQNDKDSFNILMNKTIHNLSIVLKKFSNYLNLNLEIDEIEKEIKKNYSFYWSHYLKFHLMYLRNWQVKFKDLELLQILLECFIPVNYYYEKNNINFEDHFVVKKPKIKIESPLISSSTISNITGISRATCIRKLDKLKKMKILKKDVESKKYYIDTIHASSSSSKIKSFIEEEINIFCDFYLVLIKALIK